MSANLADSVKVKQEQLMEQYKTYLHMLDSSNEQRMKTNQFFMSINTFLVTLFLGTGGYVLAYEKGLLLLLLPLAITGYCVSRVWHLLLVNYNTVNSARWKVVNEMEEQFLCKNKPFYSEWHDYLEEKDIPKGPSWLWQKSDASSGDDAKKTYYSISRIESKLPKLFGIMYIVLGIITLVCGMTTIKSLSGFWNCLQTNISFVCELLLAVCEFLFLIMILKALIKRKESAEDS